MCEWGTIGAILDINSDTIYVDGCISTYVQTMVEKGIVTLGCCCGHGEYPSSVIIDNRSADLLDYHSINYETYSENSLIHYPPTETEEERR